MIVVKQHVLVVKGLVGFRSGSGFCCFVCVTPEVQCHTNKDHSANNKELETTEMTFNSWVDRIWYFYFLLLSRNLTEIWESQTTTGHEQDILKIAELFEERLWAMVRNYKGPRKRGSMWAVTSSETDKSRERSQGFWPTLQPATRGRSRWVSCSFGSCHLN